jgi:putative addiction module killer protein
MVRPAADTGCGEAPNRYCSDGAGNLANVKGVGEGVLERTIDWGPGYRIYFGRDGKALVILLGGGTKKGQEDDIKRAKECWSDYRDRKAKE